MNRFTMMMSAVKLIHKISPRLLSTRFSLNRLYATLKVDNEEQSALSTYGTDLTDLALQGRQDPVIGRSEEIRRTLQILALRQKNNPAMIGEAGMKVTAIVDDLATRIADGEGGESIRGR